MNLMTDLPPDEIHLTTDDCLKVIKFLAVGIFESKLSRAVLWILFFMHGITNLITTYFVLFVLNREEIGALSSVYFGFIYAMLAIWFILFKPKLATNFVTRLELWATNNVDKKLRRSIEREIFLLKIFVMISFSLALVAGFLMVPRLSNDSELFFVLHFLDAYFPNYNIILGKLYKSTFPLLAYISMVQPCATIYSCQHGKLQIIMFKRYLANIANTTDNLNDLTYQEELRKRLSFCIKRYSEMLRIFTITLNEMNVLIVPFSLAGFLLGISLVVCFASGYVTPEYYARMMMFSGVAAAAFCATIWSGQSVESEAEELSKALIKADWYNFDERNKKLYLIFLLNLMKTRKIKFSEKFSINYELGLAIAKGIYSMGSVIFSMKYGKR